MPAANVYKTRCKKCCYYCRVITTFLFSHIGLCAVVFGYSVLGAFTFRALEAQNELSYRKNMTTNRNKVVDYLWDLTHNSSVLDQRNWSQDAFHKLKNF